jgi:hypothetical protein
LNNNLPKENFAKKKWNGASVASIIHAKMELNAYKSIQVTSKGLIFNKISKLINQDD